MLHRAYRASLLLATSAVAWASVASAGETITYEYDTLGRLVRVERSGTVNSGVEAQYGYDLADNRTNVAVNVPAPPPPPQPPSPPAFSVSGGTANEGSSLVFTISRSNSTAGTFSVSYATSNGSAAQYSDYYPKSGTLTFTTGDAQTVSVATVVDNNVEPAETVLMTLSNPTGGAILQAGAGQAAGTINASGTNSPPTAVTDTVSIARCVAGSFNVVANDTDPEGDLPLRLTDVGGGALQMGYVSVGSNTDVAWAKASQPGFYPVDYIVKDSRNASSTGRLNVTVTGSGTGACP